MLGNLTFYGRNPGATWCHHWLCLNHICILPCKHENYSPFQSSYSLLLMLRINIIFLWVGHMWSSTGLCPWPSPCLNFSMIYLIHRLILSFYLFTAEKNTYFEADNLHMIQKIVNKLLKKVKQWVDENNLSLNIDQTSFIILKSPRNISWKTVNIKIGNQPVKQTSYIKLLSVLFGPKS